METSSMRSRPQILRLLDRIEWDAVVTWALGFGLVAYLGLEGGGFDPAVHDQVGVAIWWVVLVAALVGALPRMSPSRLAAVALTALVAFAAWTALSLIWTESADRTSADLARLLLYVGVFVLALSVRAPREPGQLIGAVAAGIVLIAALGLLSRLHPAWFPGADQTARFLEDSRERLSYPINYWNGLAAMIGIGVPLVLHIASTARQWVWRSLAAAALPLLGLAIFFTLSRGGMVAGMVAIIVYVAFVPDRVPKLATLALAGLGSGVLFVLALQRDELRHGLEGPIARSQGDRLLLATVVVCALVALLHFFVSRALEGNRRPAWTRPTRRWSQATLGAVVVLALVAAVAFDAPGRASGALDEFKSGSNPGYGTTRLNSFAGESRYALWRSAFDENATAPLIGTGSGTFVYWWQRDAAGTEAVQDAHSLYLQTLGELGVVGFLLLATFFGTVLVGGAVWALRSESRLRSHLAAALAGAVSFAITAAVDWSWQLPALVVAFLLLATLLVMVPAGSPGWRELLRRLPSRAAVAVVSAVAIVAIAVPLATTSLLRSSRAEVRGGNLDAALADARTAENVQPAAAAPRQQQALVLERRGDLDAAARAARAATERESTNWANWLVLSRIEAERGDVDAALAAYRRARSLNPLSPLFEQ